MKRPKTLATDCNAFLWFDLRAELDVRQLIHSFVSKAPNKFVHCSFAGSIERFSYSAYNFPEALSSCRAGFPIEKSELKPYPGSLCCVLGQGTLLSRYLSQPRSINGYC